MTSETSPIQSMRRVTEGARDIHVQEFKDACNELYKLSDDIKLIMSDLHDRSIELRSYRMKISQECQAINAGFDEIDRIFAGPRGQASAKTMERFIVDIKDLRALLENKQLRKLLKIFATESETE